MSDHDGEPVQEALREQGAEQKENEERSVASSDEAAPWSPHMKYSRM